MTKHAKRFLLLAVLAGVVIGLRFTGVRETLSIGSLQRNRDMLLSFTNEHYSAAVLTYISGYVLAIAFNVPVAAVLTLAGGLLFGTVLAVVYVNIAATTGAVLAFLLARYLLGEWVQDRYRTQLARFNAEMRRNATRYLLALRLIPVFPFFLINFLAGLTNVPFRTFVWTTSLGIIPGTAVYAFAGRQLGTINSVGDVLSPHVIIALVLLALLALIPALFSRRRGTMHGHGTGR